MIFLVGFNTVVSVLHPTENRYSVGSDIALKEEEIAFMLGLKVFILFGRCSRSIRLIPTPRPDTQTSHQE